VKLDILDAPFWHITANPFGACAYDWETWAAYDWHMAHWAPAALMRVTNGR
jgi:hypothetical protein